MAFPWFEKAMQEGGVTSLDIGNETNPHSAIAIVSLAEARNKVLNPRRIAKAGLNEQTVEMFTRQVIQIGHSVEIGTLGHKRMFEIGELEGEYETEFKYFEKNPALDVARYTAARAAERWLSEEDILKDIIQHEDPAGVMKRRYYDMAGQTSILVRNRRIVKGLIEMEEFEEADAFAVETGQTAEQIMAGQPPQMPTEKGGDGQGEMLDLFQSGGRPSSAKRAAELQATPREESEG